MKHNSSLDHILSFVLRLGLFLSIVLVFYGAILLLWQSSTEIVDYHIFDGQPLMLKGLSPTFEGALKNDPLAVIQMGILILIMTPIMRVFSCLILFAVERDFLYVLLSTIVLTILLYAWI